MRRMFFSRVGFTLVEVLVAAAISLVLAGAILSLYIGGQQSFAVGSIFLEIHSGARLAMDWMARDIRGARQLVASRTISAQNYTTGTKEVILEIPSIDGSGDTIDDTYDYIVYCLNDAGSTRLERITDANAASSRADETRIVANNVGSLAFTSGGTKLSSITDVTTLSNVAIELTTSKVGSGRTLQQSTNSIVRLRNKE